MLQDVARNHGCYRKPLHALADHTQLIDDDLITLVEDEVEAASRRSTGWSRRSASASGRG